MDKCEKIKARRSISVIDCAQCQYSKLIYPTGFYNFKDVADIYGLFEALSIVEFRCMKGRLNDERIIE